MERAPNDLLKVILREMSCLIIKGFMFLVSHRGVAKRRRAHLHCARAELTRNEVLSLHGQPDCEHDTESERNQGVRQIEGYILWMFI